MGCMGRRNFLEMKADMTVQEAPGHLGLMYYTGRLVLASEIMPSWIA